MARAEENCKNQRYQSLIKFDFLLSTIGNIVELNSFIPGALNPEYNDPNAFNEATDPKTQRD